MDLMARRRMLFARIKKLVHRTITSANGLVSFKSNVEMPLKVTCEFSPVQEGTGDPSPDNVRPISGWTGCEIEHSKKNLLPPKTETLFWDTNGYIGSTGNIIQHSAYKACSKYFPAIAGSYYTFSFEGTWRGIAFYDKDKVKLTFSDKTSTLTIQAPNNAAYYRVYVHASGFNAQLEVSDTATAYESYQGETAPINWKLPDEYQEVEFITANGNQYFWSDVLIQDGLTVDSKQSFNNGDSYLFGGHADNTGNNRCAYSGHYASRVQSAYPDYFLAGAVTSDGTVFHIITTFKEGHRTIYIDGVNVMDDSRGTAVQETGKYCVVFGQRSKGDDMPGTVSNTYRGSLYSLKVSKNSVLLADYVPCYRKADSKPGMYDLVTGTFYVNQGTGDDFTVGPDASTLPGTIYGGTVTLNEDGSADLVVTQAKWVEDGHREPDIAVWSRGSDSQDYNRTLFGRLPSGMEQETKNGAAFDLFICNNRRMAGVSANLDYPSFGAYTVPGYSFSYTIPKGIETKAEIAAYFADNPSEICYNLLTPKTYHFPSIAKLNAFLGENNIWHNMNGDITVEYYNYQ